MKLTDAEKSAYITVYRDRIRRLEEELKELKESNVKKLGDFKQIKELKDQNKKLMEENLSLLAKVQELDLLRYRAESELQKAIDEGQKLFDLLTNSENCVKIDLKE